MSLSFDPAAIPPFAVVRFSHQFDGDPESISRLFVCIAHRGGYGIFVKATSQVAGHLNNPDRLAGAVYLPAGSSPCFKVDTVVQPDNPVPLLHSTIARKKAARDFEVVGTLPDGFRSSFVAAVRASSTLAPIRQDHILGLLEAR